jgi:hypothetical protein
VGVGLSGFESRPYSVAGFRFLVSGFWKKIVSAGINGHRLSFSGSRLPDYIVNKGYGQGLMWAGTAARPTEEKGFFWKPETGNRKPETGNHPGMPAHRTPL